MNLLTDEALTEKQLYRLKDHKYSSSGKSILESKLQPFWNKVVEKVPLWSRFNLTLFALFKGIIVIWKVIKNDEILIKKRIFDKILIDRFSGVWKKIAFLPTKFLNDNVILGALTCRQLFITVVKTVLKIAPNLITLLGLSINFGAFVWLLFYNGRQAPPHVYYFNAVALFLYQVQSHAPQKYVNCRLRPRDLPAIVTSHFWLVISSSIFYILSVEHREHSIQTLDAIDGKQARRTDTQSPLGELFDHGCDSLSTIFVSLSVMITVDSISSEPFYFAGKIKKS